MPFEIAIPFRLDDSGSVAVVESPDQQIRQHVMSLINTAPGERVILSDYGTPLAQMLFEDGDEAVAVELGDIISRGLSRWEPGVGLRDVAAVPGQDADGLATVSVKYSRIDSPNTATGGGTNVAIIGRGGQVYEVVKG